MRPTSVQVSPPPVTAVTEVGGVAVTLSSEKNASSSSFGAVVLKAPDCSVVLLVERPTVLFASMVMKVGATAMVNATLLTLVALATVTAGSAA